MPNSMYLKEVTTDELKCIIMSLKHSSSGCDAIHPNIVNQTFDLYIQPLLYIISM